VTPNIASQPLDATLSLSSMLKDAIIDADDKPLGRLRDVVVKLRANQYPLFSGLVIGVGSARGFVPRRDVLSMDAKSIRLRTGRVNLLPFEHRDGEVLLKQDILDIDLSTLPEAPSSGHMMCASLQRRKVGLQRRWTCINTVGSSSAPTKTILHAIGMPSCY